MEKNKENTLSLKAQWKLIRMLMNQITIKRVLLLVMVVHLILIMELIFLQVIIVIFYKRQIK
jgi:hypothetical protein